MTKIKRISREVAGLGGLVTSWGFFGPDVASQDTDCERVCQTPSEMLLEPTDQAPRMLPCVMTNNMVK